MRASKDRFAAKRAVILVHKRDDCFVFMGGTANAKHLVCQRNWGDGFHWDLGYRGKLQFLVLPTATLVLTLAANLVVQQRYRAGAEAN